MNLFARIATVLALLVGSVSTSVAEHSEIGRRAAEDFIVPGYSALVEAASLQTDAMQTLCDEPDAEHLSAARSGFAGLVIAWSRMEMIRFGPVLGDNRIDRILFWPDRQGIALRQIQALLAEKDATALQPQTLRQKSVALQGLGSLEFVLFGTGSDDLMAATEYRCALGTAIASAIQATAEEVLAAWQDPDSIAAHMANPVPENADYRTEDEVLSELLGVFIHGFELIRDVRLGPITAYEDHQPNARIALYRRSELTIEAAEASVAALQDLYGVSGMQEALSDDMSWVAGSLDFEFENFANTAREVADLPIEAAVMDETAQSKIGYLRILTQSLQTIAVQQIAVSLGLSAGFSSLDGD